MKVADRARLEALLNSYAHWEDFATYLIHHYMKDDGEFLIGSTAVSYLRIMMHVGNDTFGFNLGDYKSKLFYTCLEANNSTESAQWLREVTDNMMGLAFNRGRQGAERQRPNSPFRFSHEGNFPSVFEEWIGGGGHAQVLCLGPPFGRGALS